jgi:hypothetical protein
MKKLWRQWMYRIRVHRRVRSQCAPTKSARQHRPYQRSALQSRAHFETELDNMEVAAMGHGS